MSKVESMHEQWLNPIDPPEDTRLICKYCGEHFTPVSGEPDAYCSFDCWHLNNVGIVKNEIESWFRWEHPLLKIIGRFDCCYALFMTDSTVNRWKAAIAARYERDQQIISQGIELENYHNGY